MKKPSRARSGTVPLGRGHRFALVAWILAASTAVPLAAPPPGRSGEPPAREESLKAAIILAIVNYVEWPDKALPTGKAPFTVCVLGEAPLPLEETIREQQSDTTVLRGIEVDPQSCRVVYISRSEEGRLPDILGRLEGTGVLTVSDIEGFMEKGGMIELVKGENKFRFHINLDAASRENLKVSSQLAKLAHKITHHGSVKVNRR